MPETANPEDLKVSPKRPQGPDSYHNVRLKLSKHKRGKKKRKEEIKFLLRLKQGSMTNYTLCALPLPQICYFFFPCKEVCKNISQGQKPWCDMKGPQGAVEGKSEKYNFITAQRHRMVRSCWVHENTQTRSADHSVNSIAQKWHEPRVLHLL